MQAAWDEQSGFCNTPATAKKLGLGVDKLGDLVSEKPLPTLIAALVRCDLDNGHSRFHAGGEWR